MSENMKHLLSPLQWGDLHLANRVAMAPMTRGRAKDNLPNDLMAEYYRQRASAGILVTEGTFVSREAIGWKDAPGIWSADQAAAWKATTNAVHAHGTPIFLQLWHTGRASHSDFHDGDLPVAPSPVKHEGDQIRVPSGEKKDHETPRALETDEIPRVVQDYRKAAENAKDAGFDGVEIHAANGYLLDQFLQSKTNKRDDEYGGSVENRFRILREVVEACQEVFPAERVAVRLSPNGAFNDMGSPDFRETFTHVIKELSGYGLAYLHAIDGLDFGFHELGEAMTLEEIRALYPGRLMGNCGYKRDEADQQIAAGHADLIAFGRPFISNPDLVERFANDWEFNAESDQETWYGGGAEGYTDFPAYVKAAEGEQELTAGVR
ncbi:MAG: alkene reductase [Akkermansiaceae bacterium]|nr:alkene reductase [Akkermansiaceae bacterium]